MALKKLNCWEHLGCGRQPGGRREGEFGPCPAATDTTCDGMNDGGDRPYEDWIGKAYGESMRKIVGHLKEAGVTVVVGSPGVVDSQTWRANDPEADLAYNDNLGQLRETLAELEELE